MTLDPEVIMRLRIVLLVLLLLSWDFHTAVGQTPAADLPASGTILPLTRALLHRDPARVRQLLDAGEDPDQRDRQGFAPWMWAINFADNDALTLLLARIPSIRATDAAGRRKLAMAASLNNLAAARALLDKGVPVDSPAIDGGTPLLISAASGYIDLMKVLLAAGADPNRQDQYQDTPLMAAVRIGSRDAVKLLLDSRADPNESDGSGRTAMHWAARSGRADIVRRVLAAGARIDDIDQTGRTPMTYAREKRHAAVIEILRRRGAKDTIAVTARLPLTPRDAVEKSLPLLIRGWRSWSERQSCGACHHRLMIDRVAALGRERGFAGVSALVDDQLQFFTRNLASSEPRLRQQLASKAALLDSALGIAGDGSSGDALNLNVVLEIGVPGNAALEARALLLARKQLADGSWRTGLPRVPILSSDFTITAAAARTIAAYGGSHDAAEIADRVDRAKRWLIANRPVTTDDKASRLLGLRWTHAAESLIKEAADLLGREQNADGGWSQLPGVNSDAYATGIVLVALEQGIGMPVSNRVYRRGVAYLLDTQESDGSWFVHKRAAASNAYFDSGFPHGKFQFISYAGSCWATMALMYAATSPSGARAGAGETSTRITR
jgi:ankyrin repeat protein